MTGGKQYSSVMDILLDDEVYLKLYNLIERCNNFFGKNKAINEHTFDPDEGWGTSFEINKMGMYLGAYRNDTIALSLLSDGNYHHQNSVTSKEIIAHCGAQHTDFSPFKKIVHDKMYDSTGWFLTNNIITDDVEGELFQESTVSDVYSLFEMQEVINRIQNLPLTDKKTLTITEHFRYPRYYQNIDELLKGY